MPLPQFADGAVLTGVLGTSSSHAVAVGTTTPASGFAAEPLVEQWNGTGWNIISLSTGTGSLAAVASDGAGYVAVGSAGSHPLVLTSPTGAHWTSLPTTGLAASTTLEAVDAVGVDDIYAVGWVTAVTNIVVTAHHTSRGKRHMVTTTVRRTTRDAVVAQWNGARWHETTLVHAPMGGAATFTAISGASSSDLIVLGRDTAPQGSVAVPLVLERTAGSWIDDAPQALTHATLSSVESTPSGAWIAGSTSDGISHTALILASGTPDGSPVDVIATILLWLMASAILLALVVVLLILLVHRLHSSPR